MRADIKFLGLGLIIGIGAAALLFGALFFSSTLAAPVASQPLESTPSHTPESNPTSPPPTATFTLTPTLIVPPSNTPLPTAFATTTGTPEDMVTSLLNSGHIFITGPLSQVQQLQLYAASIQFMRGTTSESRVLGETFNGPGYGSPSDICGPLSIAILQKTGLLDASIDPHDFWLLNPDVSEKRILLNKTFPPESYENYRFKVRLNRFNWRDNPLQPGDFLYIYSGTGGNFEHMLVVNRVDSQLRAYAVTNYNTSNGFIINEVLLYDPLDPSAGIFHQWNSTQFAVLGATGYDGFELWRLRAP